VATVRILFRPIAHLLLSPRSITKLALSWADKPKKTDAHDKTYGDTNDTQEKLAIYDQIIAKCPRFERQGKTVPYTSANDLALRAIYLPKTRFLNNHALSP
jgi:hypothetical protein